MADLHILRPHRLGLAKARKAAWQWAEWAEAKFAMECTVIEGDDSDIVEFTRPGVDGTLVVSAHAFELNAKLGFLLGAFRQKIESEIEGHLDAMLGDEKKGGVAKAREAKGVKDARAAKPKATPRAKKA